jgi:hypothetical protein
VILNLRVRALDRRCFCFDVSRERPTAQWRLERKRKTAKPSAGSREERLHGIRASLEGDSRLRLRFGSASSTPLGLLGRNS